LPVVITVEPLLLSQKWLFVVQATATVFPHDIGLFSQQTASLQTPAAALHVVSFTRVPSAHVNVEHKDFAVQHLYGYVAAVAAMLALPLL